MSDLPFKNTLLRALDDATIARLKLRRISFDLRHEIEYPRHPIKHLYFLESGMASMTTTFSDGSQVEVGMFGYESVIGISALMGTRKSLNRIYTQIAGDGYYCSIEAARREFRLDSTEGAFGSSLTSAVPVWCAGTLRLSAKYPVR